MRGLAFAALLGQLDLGRDSPLEPISTTLAARPFLAAAALAGLAAAARTVPRWRASASASSTRSTTPTEYPTTKARTAVGSPSTLWRDAML
jgi:hypothetical protein